MMDFSERVIVAGNMVRQGARWSLFRWAALLLLPLVLLLAAGGCSNDAGGLPLGLASKGTTLIISVQDIKRVQEIRYLGTDELHYLVVPSNVENQLVALLLNIHNQDAARVLMTVDEEAAELRGEGPNEKYGVVDVTPENQVNVSVVEESHPSEDLILPFIVGSIALDGVPGLPQGHSVEGWVVFETPKGIRPTTLRWAAGDIVFIGE